MASLKSFNERKDKNRIVEMIDSSGATKGYPRHYIGLSGLGGGCTRALWFTFRWFAMGEISGRTNRIFNVGHASEEVMVKDLERIGIKCWNTLDDQDEFVDVYGYAMGHPDGYCSNVPGAEKTTHLLEFKTANDASFKSMVKNCLEKSKPTYYAQMVLYMYKKGLTRGLFMMVNKNTSAYYIERVKCNTSLAKELLSKGESVVFSEDFNDFPRIGNNSPTWYECKWCGYNDICFGKKKPELKNCRNCKNMDLVGEGKFSCSIKDKHLNLEEQIAGCKDHTFLDCIK